MNRLKRGCSSAILLLMLCIGFASAQERGRFFIGNGYPQKGDFDTGDYYRDTTKGVDYIYIENRWFSDKSVSHRYLRKREIPVGSDYISPEDYGARRGQQTLRQAGYTQAQVDLMFPATGAKLDDQVDWAALQRCLNELPNTPFMVASPRKYYINRKLTLPTAVEDYVINWNMAVLMVTSDYSDIELLACPTPKDMTEANVWVMRSFHMYDLKIRGKQSVTAITPGPTYGSWFQNIKVWDCKTAIHTQFSLHTKVYNSQTTNCINGFLFDRLYINGATTANSQSNHSGAWGSRCYMPANGNVAIGFYAASGGVSDGNIIEGHKVKYGIVFDGQNSTVVKDGSVILSHMEVVQGSDAFVYVRLLGGIVTIDKAFGQYPALLVDAESSSGLGVIRVMNVPYWVDKSGKRYNNKDCAWMFEAVEGQTVSNTPGLFTGKPVKYCGGSGCGYNGVSISTNEFNFKYIPR